MELEKFAKEMKEMEDVFEYYLSEGHKETGEEYFIIASRMVEKCRQIIDKISDRLEEEENEDNDDCDYDMGFDPYLGCFSDDC